MPGLLFIAFNLLAQAFVYSAPGYWLGAWWTTLRPVRVTKQ